MRYLYFSILLLLQLSCTSTNKGLIQIPARPECISKMKPQRLNTTWYTTTVDVAGRHLSGLLLIKAMEDNSTRVVFANEAGITFFDFEFGQTGDFKVKQIIQQLNKKPVVNTLQKDFSLVLGLPFESATIKSWAYRSEIYHGVEQKKEIAYFITDQDCASLRRLELASKTKAKVTVLMEGNDRTSPDIISIKHHSFKMDIQLKKIER